MTSKGKRISITIIIVISVVFATLFVLNKFIITKTYNLVIAEAGTGLPDVLSFLRNKKDHGEFQTDISVMNLNIPGIYQIKIKINNRIYSSKLKIQDTIAPVAEIANSETWVNKEKEPKEFVRNIIDVTDVKVSFGKCPDFSKKGMQELSIILTDTSGNITELKSTVNVIEDTEPPRIEGVHDQIVYIDDKISYKRNIIVSDNCDDNIQLIVDSSMVNIKKTGSYNVIYSSTDSSGNIAIKKCIYKVIERPKYDISKDDLDILTDRKLASIIKDNM